MFKCLYTYFKDYVFVYMISSQKTAPLLFFIAWQADGPQIEI